MQNHVRVYLEYFNYSGFEWMQCEVYGGTAVEIHHIIPRSKFGSKMKLAQDRAENLMALCRSDHEKAHDGTYTQEYLQELHNAFMGK